MLIGRGEEVALDALKLESFAALIVGAGLFGGTMANLIRRATNQPVLVIDRRSSVGGNISSETWEDTGIEIHKYGPHIFHTSNHRIWDFCRSFTDFNNYRHHVWSIHNGRHYPMPISLPTMEAFWQTSLSPAEAKKKMEEVTKHYHEGANFEDLALKSIGEELYEAFIKGYTAKQWQTDPKHLPVETFSRLPIRFDRNTRYFNDRFEGIPSDGYQTWAERIFEDDLIHVALDTDWSSVKSHLPRELPVIYSGAIDEYFDYKHGLLGWRTLDFEFISLATTDYQGCAQVNFPDPAVPFTREVEYRHFRPENKNMATGRTVISREYSRFAGIGDEPYYPIRRKEDLVTLAKYEHEAALIGNTVFGGRLGNYRYFDMHTTVGNAFKLFDSRVSTLLAL